MIPEDSTTEIQTLLGVFNEGALSDEQRTRLHELLSNDPKARKAFVREQLIDAAFQLDSAGNIGSDDLLAPEFPDGARPTNRWNWAFAAGIIFLIGLGLGGAFRTTDKASNEFVGVEDIGPVDDGVALLTQTVDAVWENEVAWHSGDVLSAGKLSLLSGLAQIEFYSGAMLVLEGPAELELLSVNDAVCRRGKLRASVPSQARGFSVTSPMVELVDLGTEFGMEVGIGGKVDVHVFDGQVELYPPDGKRDLKKRQLLESGTGMSWAATGEVAKISPRASEFTSFESVRSRTARHCRRKLAAWQEWNAAVARDPRVWVRYDFESSGSTLSAEGTSPANGAIVGGEWVNGRWPDKSALGFTRPGDRIRIEVPGEHEAVTLAAWIRVDALPGRNQALLLTDGYEIGHAHWQISERGELRLGVRIPAETTKDGATGYGTSAIFTPRRLGNWNFVATVYDSKVGFVRHFLNGHLVSKAPIVFKQPLRIGAAEIGNWGVPLKGPPRHVVRNFVGRMDELTIWKSALAAEEIHDIYHQSKP